MRRERLRRARQRSELGAHAEKVALEVALVFGFESFWLRKRLLEAAREPPEPGGGVAQHVARQAAARAVRDAAEERVAGGTEQVKQARRLACLIGVCLIKGARISRDAVSYTHLTLPTILLV